MEKDKKIQNNEETGNRAFVESPNLPRTAVSAAVISGIPSLLCTGKQECYKYNKLYCEIYNNLAKRNISLIKTTGQPELAPPVRCHPDMQCHHLGKSNIIVANQFLYKKLKSCGMSPIYIEKELKEKYPENIALNALRIGNLLFAKTSSLSSRIVAYCNKNAIRIIPVSQGYSKCSTAVISETAAITSDCAIYAHIVKLGLQALLIRAGCIELPGYNYGFIGGACGLISAHELAFAGDITKHPDYGDIKTFLKRQNVEPVCLHNGCLLDIGSILPVMERPL